MRCRQIILTCLSTVLALGLVACGSGSSSGGGGDSSGSGGGGATGSYTWSTDDPPVTIPALPSAIVVTTARMRIKCLSKSLITTQVRLLVAVDSMTRIDKSVTMTLLIAKSPTVPYNIYIYDLNENLGTIAAGTNRSISVTIDPDNVYSAPVPVFNIQVFSIVIAVAPSYSA